MLPQRVQADWEEVAHIKAIPTILEVVCLTTGMGFAAVARVSEDRWIACSVLDRIQFGLKPGGELKIETTICNEIRQSRHEVIIDDVANDNVWCKHPTPAMYGFRSYISMPIILPDGAFFGTLCAIDPHPAHVNTPQIVGMFRLFAELIAKHLDALSNLVEIEHALELARSAMEGNSDCVKVLDLDGHLLSMNQNGCRLMEVDDFRAIQSRPWSDFWKDPERTKVLAAVAAARAAKASRFTGSCETAKGKEKYWEVTVNPVVDAEGKAIRILSIARDITSRRIEEAHLREVAKLESLGVLAGGVAHDFNNLLTGILGNASLVELSSDPEARERGRDIVKAADRAADLTRQLLAYAGKGRFLIERVNLSSLVVEILKLIEATMDKKAELVLHLDHTLPPVDADPSQMQQLIMNLLINASEALEGRLGKVIVSTATIEIDADFIAQTFRADEPSLVPGQFVQLQVHDTGCGMSAETLARVFDPFFTTKFTGRGLGLAAISGILRGHRGAVRVYSHPGQGTTFKIFLPVAAEFQRNATVQPPETPSPRRGWGTVLFIDDEETVRTIARTALRLFGYDVLLAENGQQGVEIFREHNGSIRLIILDLTMPVMNGEEALVALRKIDSQIPIVLSSGYNQVEIIRRFTTQTITGFVQKPYTMTRLIETVTKALPDGRTPFLDRQT